MRTCSTCGIDKPESHFYRDTIRDSYQRECKQCTRIRLRERYWNPDSEAQRWADYIASADFGQKLVDGFDLLSEDDPADGRYEEFLRVLSDN